MAIRVSARARDRVADGWSAEYDVTTRTSELLDEISRVAARLAFEGGGAAEQTSCPAIPECPEPEPCPEPPSEPVSADQPDAGATDAKEVAP